MRSVRVAKRELEPGLWRHTFACSSCGSQFEQDRANRGGVPPRCCDACHRCVVEGCDNKPEHGAMCGNHRSRQHRGMSLGGPMRKVVQNKGKLCAADGCALPAYTRLLCRKHYVAMTNDPRSARNRLLMRNYGITIDQYEEMLAAQGGTCAVCHRTESRRNHLSGKPDPLNVDHCHGTGKIRGLLCSFCNSALGLLGDDRDGVRALMEYMDRNG